MVPKIFVFYINDVLLFNVHFHGQRVNVIKKRESFFRNRSFIFVCLWRNSLQWARISSFPRFLDHTQRRTLILQKHLKIVELLKKKVLSFLGTGKFVTKINGPYLEPAQCDSHSHTQLTKTHFNIVLQY